MGKMAPKMARYEPNMLKTLEIIDFWPNLEKKNFPYQKTSTTSILEGSLVVMALLKTS